MITEEYINHIDPFGEEDWDEADIKNESLLKRISFLNKDVFISFFAVSSIILIIFTIIIQFFFVFSPLNYAMPLGLIYLFTLFFTYPFKVNDFGFQKIIKIIHFVSYMLIIVDVLYLLFGLVL